MWFFNKWSCLCFLIVLLVLFYPFFFLFFVFGPMLRRNRYYTQAPWCAWISCLRSFDVGVQTLNVSNPNKLIFLQTWRASKDEPSNFARYERPLTLEYGTPPSQGSTGKTTLDAYIRMVNRRLSCMASSAWRTTCSQWARGLSFSAHFLMVIQAIVIWQT